MKYEIAVFTKIKLALLILILQLGSTLAYGEINAWTNPGSAHWEDAYWSLGVRPASNQDVMITNAGYKAVGIFPTTPTNYPQSMTVSNLTIAAPPNALSTLLLNYSGTSTPLRVLKNCEIGTNGMLTILYSGFRVEGGLPSNDQAQFSIHGTLEQTGGLLLATNGRTWLFGGTATMNGDCVFGAFYIYPGTFNQSSGLTLMTNLYFDGGVYNLTNGVLGPQSLEIDLSGGGGFYQYGGTNLGQVQLGEGLNYRGGYGSYRLYGGLLEGNIHIGPTGGGYGDFYQYGGLVRNNEICIGCSASGFGHHSLTNGTVNTGSVGIYEGSMDQAGGVLAVTSGLFVSGYFDDYGHNRFANFNLSNGVLSCGSLSLSMFGTFGHSGGTNAVAGDLAVSLTTYSLASGTLVTSNTVLYPARNVSSDNIFVNSDFIQSGGIHKVNHLLSDAGQYTLSGGTLTAPTIAVPGKLVIAGGGAAPIIDGNNLFILGGAVEITNSTLHLGQMILSSNAKVDLTSSPGTLAFAASASNLWTNGTTLTVTHWIGSTNGGGADQLRFGTDASGLTITQLGQIQFINPAGLPAGSYFAKLLATGEVVPIFRPLLFPSIAGRNLILNWSGSYALQRATNVQGVYVDVPGATSPYTNATAQYARQFFRLIGP